MPDNVYKISPIRRLESILKKTKKRVTRNCVDDRRLHALSIVLRASLTYGSDLFQKSLKYLVPMLVSMHVPMLVPLLVPLLLPLLLPLLVPLLVPSRLTAQV